MSGMREKMPTVAAWVDDLRGAFGAEMVNRQIKGGMNGLQTFYAEENGFRVGTLFDEPDTEKVFSGDRLVLGPVREKTKGGPRD